jgi:hypothetical protein
VIHRSHAVIAVILTGTPVACMGPMRQHRATSDYVRNAAPAVVRVTLVNGTTHELSGPQIVLDSLLTGWIRNGAEFIGFPLTEVESVSARERSAGRTALLVGSVAAAIITVVALSGGSGIDTGEPDPEGEP